MRVAIYDVFAKRPFSGNQAAVARARQEGFSDSQLVALAAELSLAETALLSAQGNDLVFRFATADRIINRCGHATLAGVADHVISMLRSGRVQDREMNGSYRVGASVAAWRARKAADDRLHDNAGAFDIAVAWPDRPKFVKALPAREVYRALRLDASDGAAKLPRCVYDSGNLNALVPVRTISALQRADPDWNRLRALFERFCLTDLHLYYLQGRKPASQQLRLRCRNFFPYGVFEEMATGSASIALAAALADHLPGLTAGGLAFNFVFDQGNDKRRGNIRVRWRSGKNGHPSIWLEGRVFRIVQGRLVAIPARRHISATTVGACHAKQSRKSKTDR